MGKKGTLKHPLNLDMIFTMFDKYGTIMTVDVINFFSFTRKTNIFDSMIYMMENYTDNLEDLVTERTGQLIEAKRETEELLDKILPRYKI